MKEPNKSKEKEAKSTFSKDTDTNELANNNKCDDTLSESKDKRSDSIQPNEKTINEEESELSKALKRIKELEESNRQLAQKRITELEETNRQLSQSECNERRKEKPKSSKSHRSSKNKDKAKDDKDVSHYDKELLSDSSRKRKASTASSSSSSIKSPPFAKSESVQSKLKLLGLSDCNESSDDNEEEQQAAFQDLFGFKNKSSHIKKSSNERKLVKTSKEKSAKIDQLSTEKPPPSSITKERDSSSSPNLSDLEERIKVEQEVMQVVAHEAESEKLDQLSKNDTSEHDQLAAWLGN